MVAAPRFAVTRFQASNTMRFDIANDFVDVTDSIRNSFQRTAFGSR
jgi:hypothetical protein